MFALSAAGAFHLAMGYVLVTGPRMRIQPNVHTYQAEVPPMPAGAVPVSTPDAAPNARVPSDAETEVPSGMAAASAESVARGRVYYQYYCVFCHGETGDGNGPVGQSYVPRPSDLRAPRVGAFSDGDLLRAMLAGTGHAPVLERVVPGEHRGPLMHYVRTLGSPAK